MSGSGAAAREEILSPTLRPPLDSSRGFWIGLYASYPAIGSCARSTRLGSPTNSGVEDNALWNRTFRFRLYSCFRPALGSERPEARTNVLVQYRTMKRHCQAFQEGHSSPDLES